MKIGNIELKSPQANVTRFSLMLWGSSGTGKTTLAATAPGKILWINFDPDGTNSLTEFDQDKFVVLDLSTNPDNVVMQFRKADGGYCRDIEKLLKEHEDIQTVVVDSLTTFGDKALSHGVIEAQSTTKGAKSTIEDPGYGGYGNKNTWTNLVVKNLLQITGRLDRNVIFIAHEDKPERDDKGVVLYISIMLGSSLNEQLPVKLSEIWNLTDTGKERRIAIRPCRGRKPMKTRMFKTSGQPEFTWNFDAETQEGDTIEDWLGKWKANDFRKMDLPS